MPQSHRQTHFNKNPSIAKVAPSAENEDIARASKLNEESSTDLYGQTPFKDSVLSDLVALQVDDETSLSRSKSNQEFPTNSDRQIHFQDIGSSVARVTTLVEGKDLAHQSKSNEEPFTDTQFFQTKFKMFPTKSLDSDSRLVLQKRQALPRDSSCVQLKSLWKHLFGCEERQCEICESTITKTTKTLIEFPFQDGKNYCRPASAFIGRMDRIFTGPMARRKTDHRIILVITAIVKSSTTFPTKYEK